MTPWTAISEKTPTEPGCYLLHSPEYDAEKWELQPDGWWIDWSDPNYFDRIRGFPNGYTHWMKIEAPV